MEWPDNFNEEEEDFEEVLYTDEEASIRLAELNVAALKAGLALKNLGRAVGKLTDALTVIRDNHVLSQDEIDIGD